MAGRRCERGVNLGGDGSARAGKPATTTTTTSSNIPANRLGAADDALLYLVHMAEVEQTKQRWVPGRPDGASVDDAG